MEPNQFVTPKGYGMRLCGIAAGLACLAFTASAVALAAPEVAPAVKAQAQSNYGKLPLSFEANYGQTDAQVKFLARGHGYALFLTPGEAVLSLKPQAQPGASSPDANGTVLRMQLVGANPAPWVSGKEALPGQVNYLIGNDPAKWRTGVPTYGKVAYESVYSGVDLVYYGNQRQLEYDFVVAPGTNPRKIKLAFQGADKIEVSRTGELILHAANGDVHMHKPILYQEVRGIRRLIDGGYVLKDGKVGFRVAAYDAARPLIIDPVLVYSTYLGGSQGETGFGIAVDQQGQAYVTGRTSSPDFPPHNALQPASGGGISDAFVAQITADGQALRYSTYLGGSGEDTGLSIAVDRRGQASVTGVTSSSDFPTKNALQPTSGGGFSDAFVAQLTADGRALRYSTYLGGSGNDSGESIAVGTRGQAYVTGITFSPDFPTKNALQSDFGGNSDAFVAQFTTNGRALRYSTYLGGSEGDAGRGIAVDQWDQAYVTGDTGSSDFPTEDALQPDLGGNSDAFVAQFTADGAVLRYATYLGGSGGDGGNGIAVDRQGQAYVTGVTYSFDFPTKNAVQPVTSITTAILGDAFVSQLTADGKALGYSTYLGGFETDAGEDIAVDQRGQAYVTGFAESGDFPTVNSLQPVKGLFDAFVTQFTADGTALRYSTVLGGSLENYGFGIAVDQCGQAYVTGLTNSFDFPTQNALQPALGGGFLDSDAFVTKIGSDGRLDLGKKCTGSYEDNGKNGQREHGSKN